MLHAWRKKWVKQSSTARGVNVGVATVPRGARIATNVGVAIITDCVNNKKIGNARCAKTKKFEISSM